MIKEEEKLKIGFIEVPVKYGIIKININEILYIEADGSYSEFVLKTGNKTISWNLKKTVSMLHKNFLKTHRSFVVNLAYPGIVVAKNCSYIKISAKKVPVSKRMIYEFAKLANKSNYKNPEKIDSRQLAVDYLEEKIKKSLLN